MRVVEGEGKGKGRGKGREGEGKGRRPHPFTPPLIHISGYAPDHHPCNWHGYHVSWKFVELKKKNFPGLENHVVLKSRGKVFREKDPELVTGTT